MAIEFFPKIVIDKTTGKTFRQSRFTLPGGMKKHRRAKAVAPGIWLTYGNVFSAYPRDFKLLEKSSRFFQG